MIPLNQGYGGLADVMLYYSKLDFNLNLNFLPLYNMSYTLVLNSSNKVGANNNTFEYNENPYKNNSLKNYSDSFNGTNPLMGAKRTKKKQRRRRRRQR